MVVGISQGGKEKQGVVFGELHSKVIGVSVPRLGLHLYAGVTKKNRTFLAFSKLDKDSRAVGLGGGFVLFLC